MNRIAALILKTVLVLSPLFSFNTAIAETNPQTFRFAIEQDIETLDPQQNNARFTTSVTEGISESLLREHNGEILPGVAEKFETADFKTWTFHLRKDAKWSDGTPITAEDFLYSYQLIFQRPESAKTYILFEGVKGYQAISQAIKAGKTGDELKNIVSELGVKVIDPQTLVVELDNPRPYFANTFASSAWSPIKKDLYEANQRAYGSSADKIGMNGPFIIKEWLFNDRVVLVKNPNYWNSANIKLDTVEILIVKDAEPRLNLYKEGRIDMTTASSEIYATMKDDVFMAPGSGWNYLLANKLRRNEKGEVLNRQLSELIQNRHFINALSNTIDRTVLYTRVMENPSFEPTGWVIPGTINSNNADRQVIEQIRNSTSPHPINSNPELAKSELETALKEVGYSSAKDVPAIGLAFAATPDNKTINEFIKLVVEQELGLTINLEPVEFGVRDSRIISGDYDLLLMGWSINVDDALSYLDIWSDNLFATGWPEAESEGFNSYKSLIDNIKSTTDINERANLIIQAEESALNNGPFIPLSHVKEIVLLNKNVNGFNLRRFNAPYDYIFATVNN